MAEAPLSHSNAAEARAWPGRGALRPLPLPDGFQTPIDLERVGVSPRLVHASETAGSIIGLGAEQIGSAEMLEILSGRAPVADTQRVASVYAGHQFGHYVPQLGDGRAVTIAAGAHDGELWELQLKGAGRTPYSRFGDGRAVMRSTLREYLCSEHMAALGIPTTRALSVVATYEGVQREEVEPGAILGRVAPSHVRFGHFEYYHHTNQPEKVATLADWVIDNFYPDAKDVPNRYVAWFREVVERTADLIASWQAVGFAHGVMNTDNMSILGLTIDYGPFGFLDTYDPKFICNHSDHAGRYAFDQQPSIGLWNLRALAVALSSLIDQDDLVDALNAYAPRIQASFEARMAAKLGLDEIRDDKDRQLVADLLSAMANGDADYTLTFRHLTEMAAAGKPMPRFYSLFGAEAQPAIRVWARWYFDRLADGGGPKLEKMRNANPHIVLRNWVAEAAIRAVEDDGDLKTLDQIFGLVTSPFDAPQGDAKKYSAPPPEALRGLSVSCSS